MDFFSKISLPPYNLTIMWFQAQQERRIGNMRMHLIGKRNIPPRRTFQYFKLIASYLAPISHVRMKFTLGSRRYFKFVVNIFCIKKLNHMAQYSQQKNKIMRGKEFIVYSLFFICLNNFFCGFYFLN